MIDKKPVIKRKYMRAREVADNYPIGMSTIWNWACKKKLTAIKVSEGTTVFLVSELENLFNTKEPKKRIRRRKRIKNTQTTNSTQGRKNV